MPAPSIHLGTSGWTYPHWKGKFYPEGLAQKKWFDYYCSRFSTVELNASFYRIPSAAAVESWEKRSPPDFRFAVKISRLISHVKKLRNCEKETEWFFSTFAPLAHRIGAFLLQLPPSLKCNPELVGSFVRQTATRVPIAVEFRNSTWYNDEVYAALKEFGCIFCIHDMNECPTERIVLSKTAYVRFHGYQARYGGDYPSGALADWGRWIKRQAKDGTKVFGYFNNDVDGFAVKNCMTLRAMVGETV